MDIMERLLDVAADRSGDGPSGPAYDPELLTVMSEAADEISRLRGTHAADDERLATAAQRVGIVAGCDAAEWMADEIARLRDENANLTHENDKLWAELRVCAAALPGPYYMDPPDGGSVTVAEQVARMAKDAEKWREREAKIAGLKSRGFLGSPLRDAHDSDCATHNEPAYPNGPCDCSAAMQTEPAPEEPRVMARFDDGRPMMTYHRAAMQKGE